MAEVARVDGTRRAGVAIRPGFRSPGLMAMVSMEWLKLLKRPMTWFVFLFMVPGTAGIMVMSFLSVQFSNLDAASKAQHVQGVILPEGIGRTMEIVGVLGSILLVVLAAGLIGSEYGWGTIRPLVGSGTSRSKVFLAKLIALVEVVIAFVILAIAAGCLASVAIAVFEGKPITLGAVDTTWVIDLALSIARTMFVIFVSATLAFSVAFLTRSLAAGIGIGIGWTILERIVNTFADSLGDLGKIVHQALISTNTDALIPRNGFGTPKLPPDTPAEYQALSILVLYCILLLGFAWLVFRRRDIASSS